MRGLQGELLGGNMLGPGIESECLRPEGFVGWLQGLHRAIETGSGRAGGLGWSPASPEATDEVVADWTWWCLTHNCGKWWVNGGGIGAMVSS